MHSYRVEATCEVAAESFEDAARAIEEFDGLVVTVVDIDTGEQRDVDTDSFGA